MRDVEQGSNRIDAKKLWDLGWGLLLVVVLTVLSEWGPQLGFSKTADAASQIAPAPATHTVK